MRRTMRMCVVVLAATAGLAVPSMAGAEPVRSGTILTGFPGSACGYAPDCYAWLESGCDPALAGRNPAWMTSIVDVADLADGTTWRVFDYDSLLPSPTEGPYLNGGVYIQFYREDCVQKADAPGYKTAGAVFPIPSGAKWMTVANLGSYTEWELSTSTAPPVPPAPPPLRTFYFAE